MVQSGITEVQTALATLKEHITDPKMLKALAVCEAVINAATNISNDLTKAYPPRRIFRKVDRRPRKRFLKNKSRINLIMGPVFARNEIQKIMAMPVPNYPSGGISWSRELEVKLPQTA